MAIWQYNIYLIPRQSLSNKYGKVPRKLNFEEALDIEWWSDIKVPTEQFLPILEQFGEVQEWTKNLDGLRSFGNTEADDLSVGFNTKTKIILELHCRIDLRKINKQFLNQIFLLARDYDCMLMDIQGNLFEPKSSAIQDSISLSNANRFIQDPKMFFDDLANGFIAPEGKANC